MAMILRIIRPLIPSWALPSDYEVAVPGAPEPWDGPGARYCAQPHGCGGERQPVVARCARKRPGFAYAGFFDSSGMTRHVWRCMNACCSRSWESLRRGPGVPGDPRPVCCWAFTIHYFDHCWPVAPQSYALILEQRRDALATFLGEVPEPLAEYDSILTAIRNLPLRSETDQPEWPRVNVKRKSSSGAWQR